MIILSVNLSELWDAQVAGNYFCMSVRVFLNSTQICGLSKEDPLSLTQLDIIQSSRRHEWNKKVKFVFLYAGISIFFYLQTLVISKITERK